MSKKIQTCDLVSYEVQRIIDTCPIIGSNVNSLYLYLSRVFARTGSTKLVIEANQTKCLTEYNHLVLFGQEYRCSFVAHELFPAFDGDKVFSRGTEGAECLMR